MHSQQQLSLNFHHPQRPTQRLILLPPRWTLLLLRSACRTRQSSREGPILVCEHRQRNHRQPDAGGHQIAGIETAPPCALAAFAFACNTASLIPLLCTSS
jgi:hypothetical protein